MNKGEAKFSSYSADVFFEGENVARLSDSMTMNGNQPNTATDAEIQENLERELGIVFDILSVFAPMMAAYPHAFAPKRSMCSFANRWMSRPSPI